MKILLFLILFFPLSLDAAPSIVQKMAAAHGGRSDFYHLRDVSYELTILNRGKTRKVLKERLYFDGEKSSASILDASNESSQDMEPWACKTKLKFDGSEICCDGPATRLGENEDEALRSELETHYFLFALPFKLLDSGYVYHRSKFQKETQAVLDVRHVSSEKTEFRLFLRQKDHLLERVVFSSPDWRAGEITILVPKYEKINGLQLWKERHFYPGNWKGEIKGEKYETHVLKAIHFWNGFTDEDFACPKPKEKKS